jgi:signal transduction histidine kinase
VEISALKSANTVTIRISDDGPGIPEADIPNLFEPFFRVDRSRSKKTGGFGLGLSICKRIMEAHGGTIQAQTMRDAVRRSFLLCPSPPEVAVLGWCRATRFP